MGLFSSIFSSKKKLKVLETDWLQGWCDFHCHLLPAVDDGSRNIEETKDLLSFLRQAGVVQLGFSPHIHNKYPKNDYHSLQEVFAQTKERFYDWGISFYLGAEYMLDEFFSTQIDKPLLTIGSSDKLLVEMSFASRSNNYKDRLPEIKSKGAFPILAHPERYLYLSIEEYEDLKYEGWDFQMNLFSLGGVYGEEAKKRAYLLLENGFYDYVASDTHRIQSFLRWKEQLVVSSKYENAIRDLVENNQTLFPKLT